MFLFAFTPSLYWWFYI